MPFFILDRNLCKKDNICVKLCPAGIIKLDNEQFPYIDKNSASRCIKCGQCVSFCPHGACSVESVPNLIKIDKTLIPSPEQADMLILSRRSIRMFRNEELSKKEITSLLKIAETAPTAGNRRVLRWIVIGEREKLNKAGSLVAEYFKKEAEKHEKAMPQEAEFMKRLAAAHEEGKQVFFRGAPQLIIAASPEDSAWKMEDGVAALTYLELAAHGHGIGMCWAGYFITAARNYKPLQDYLGITKDEYICGAQMTGYPVLGTAKKVPEKKSYSVSYI